MYKDFPGNPVVKTLPSSEGSLDSVPCRGVKIPHASQKKKKENIKQKQYCNKFNKDFKNMVHIKNLMYKKKSYVQIDMYTYLLLLFSC